MDPLLHPSDPRIQPHLAALESEPGQRAALEALASIFGGDGQWGALLSLYEREAARVVDPAARGDLYFLAGRAWEERVGNRPEATRCYQLAHRADPRARMPLLAAERLYRDLGQWSMVARLLELQIEAETDPREQASLWSSLGELCRNELGDARRASAAYAEALRADEARESDREALRALEAAHQEHEATAASLRADAQAAAEATERASLLLQAAELIHRENRGAADAEADLRSALEADPSNPRAAALLAEVLAAQGRYEELTSFLRARAEGETDDKRRVALLASAASYAALRGDDATARESFEAVLAVEPTQADALAALLPLWRRARAFDAFLAHADRIVAVGAGPELLPWVLRAAAEVAWHDLGDRVRAKAYVDALRTAAPGDPLAAAFDAAAPATVTPAEYKTQHAGLVQKARGAKDVLEKREHWRAAARLGEAHGPTPKDAIDAWRAVLELDKTDGEAQRHLRALYRRGERWHALVELLKQIVEQMGAERVEDRLAIYEEMADVYASNLSMEPMVINTLQSVLTLQPNHRPTLERLAKIYERRENWGQLADVLGRKADASESPAERLALLHRSAELWLTRLQSPEDAIRRYEQVLSLDPADGKALAALRKVYEQRRAYEPLVQVYLREIDTLPSDDERLRRAREVAEWAQKHLHRPTRLIELWNKVLQFDPKDGKALAALAALYEREERWAAVVEVLERQIAETADKRARIMALKKLGQLLADKLGRDDLAVATWQRALDEDPDNAEMFKLLRDRHVKARRFDALEALYARRGKWEEYVDVLVVQAEAVTDPAERATVYFQIAGVWEEKLGRKDRAARVYERVLELDPTNVRAAAALEPVFEKSAEWRKLTQVAEVLAAAEPEAAPRAERWQRVSKLYEEKLKRPAEAFAAASRALEDAPELAGLVEKLEQLAELTNLHADAATAFERARERCGSADARVDLGKRAARLYDQRLRAPEQAIAAYEAIAKDAPADAESHGALLRLYEATSSWEKLAELRRAELDRAETATAREAARFAIAALEEERLGQPERAVETYEAIVAESEDSTAALDQLARLQERLGRSADLARTLEHRLALTPPGAERVPLLRRLGELAMGPLGDAALAVKRFRALLSVAPDDTAAEESLETLRVASEAAADAAALLVDRYRARAAHERLLPALETLVEHGTESAERLELLLEIGRVEEGERRQLDRAFDAFERAMREEPNDERAFAELDRLAPLLDREARLAELITAEQGRVERRNQRARLAARAGVLYLDLDRRKDAIPAFASALELGLPDDEARSALRALARLYELQAQWPELREALARALELAETSAERKALLLRRGALFEDKLDAPTDAIAAYRDALALDPDDEVALDRLDVLYDRAREHARLADILAAKLRNAKGPGESAKLHLRLGHLLASELARTSEALDEFRAVLEIDPDSDDAVTAIEALVDFDEELKVLAAETLAPIYERRGDQEKVRTALEALLPARPPEERVEILLRVGAMSEESGNADRAWDAYARALRERPGHGGAREKLGKLAATSRRWPELLELLEADLPSIAATDDALATLATMADAADRELKDVPRALGYFERMFDLDAESVLAFERMGGLLEREARFDELVKLVERREKVTSEIREVERLALRKGELLASRLGDKDGAIAAYLKAEAVAPESLEVLDALEGLYAETSRHEALVGVHLRRAELAGEGDERRTRLLRAAALLEAPIGDRPRAIELYRRLVDLDPKDRAALLALSRLYEAEDDATALLGVLELLVECTEAEAERVELRHRIARLVEEPLADPARAVELYEAIVRDAPEHAATVAALERLAESGTERLRAARVLAPLYDARGDHAGIVRAARIELSETEEPEGRVALYHRIAETSERHLGDRAAALEAYREALHASTLRDPPIDERTLAEVERLATEDGAHRVLAGVYTEVLASVSEPSRAKLVAQKLARLYDEVLREEALAIEEFRRVLVFDPKDLPALRALDRLYEHAGRHADLCEILRREIELCDEPEEVVTLNHRLGAILADALEDPAAAVAAFASALDFDDKHAPTLAALRKLVDARQEVPAIVALVSPIARRREDFAEVVHLLDVQYEVEPESAQRKAIALEAAAIYEERLGSFPDAFRALARALREEPADRETASELTRVAGEAELWRELASVLDKERSRVDDDALAERFALEVASLHLVHLGERDEAAVRYEDIVAANPRCIPALRALDRVYTEAREHRDLARILALEAETAPQKADQLGYRLRLAETQENLVGDVDAAIETYRGVLDAEPGQTQALDALERIFRERDDAESLFGIYEARLHATDDPPARLPLLSAMAVLAAERLHRDADAIELWLEVQRLAPEHAPDAELRALRALERLYDQTGRYAELAEALGRRAELVPDAAERVEIEARRAEVYADRLGLDDEAITSWRAVLADRPGDERALLALTDLYRRGRRSPELAEMLRLRVDRAASTGAPLEERIELLADRASVEADALLRPDLAVATWNEVLALDSRYLPALDALEQIHAQEGAFDRVTEIIERRASLEGTDDARIAALFATAELRDRRMADADGAAAIYERILEERPEDPKASELLEQLYERTGNHERVAELLLGRLESIAASWERLALLRRIAEIYLERLARPDMAFIVLCRAVREDPRDSALLAEVERLARLTGSVEELVYLFEDMIVATDDPTERAPLHATVARYYDEDLGRADLAVGHYNRLLETSPTDAPALDALETLLRREGRLAELADVLRRKAEHTVELHERKAHLYALAELFEGPLARLGDAAAALEEILRLDEAEEPALTALRRIYRRLGLWQELIRALERQLALTYDVGDAVELRREIAAILDRELGEHQAAADVYREVLSSDPNDADAAQSLERILTLTHRWDELVLLLSEQVSFATTDAAAAELYEKVGALWEDQLGRPERAIEAYRAILRIDPRHHGALDALERLHASRSEWDELAAILEREADAARNDEDRARALRRLGETFELRLHDHTRAVDAYQRALEVVPSDAEALAALAGIYEDASDYRSCVDMLERSATAQPDPRRQAEMWHRVAVVTEEHLHDAERAEAALRRSIAVDETFVPSLASLRALVGRRGAWKEAVELLSREDRQTFDARRKLELACEMGRIAAVELRDRDGAIAHYELALERAPDAAEAAGPLADLYYKRGDFGRARELLEIVRRRSPEATGADAALARYRLADSALRAGDEAGALVYFQEAYDADVTHLQTLVAFGALLFKHGEWERAFKVYQSIVVHHSESADVDAVDVYYKLGVVRHRLGERRKAIHSFDKALELDPTHVPTLRALAEAYEETEEWEEAVEIRKRLVDAVEDADEKLDLAVSIGDLYRERLAQRARAVTAYTDALDLAPGNLVVLHKLLELYTEGKEWTRAIEALEQIAAKERDPEKLGTYYYSIAVILRDELKDPDGAVSALNRTLDVNPTRLKAFEAIDKLLTQRRDWPALAQSYQKMLERLPEGASRDIRFALWRGLGEIHRTRLRNFAEAIPCFEQAASINPNDVELRVILAELYETAVDSYPKAIEVHRALLAADPGRFTSYHGLYRLHRLRGEHDRAYWLCQVMRYLGQLNDEELQYSEEVRQVAPRRPGRALDERAWHYVFHPSEDRILGRIFGMLATPIAQEYLQNPKDLGIKKKDRIETGDLQIFFSRIFQLSRGVLGVAPPEVYLKADSAGLTLTNTAPVTLFAGPDMVQDRPEAELAFALAKNLSYLRPEHFVSALLPTLVDTMFYAGVRACYPTQKLPSDRDPRDIDELAKRIKKALPPPAMSQLQALLQQFYQQGRHFDALGWLASIEHTGDRAGFLLANDLAAAEHILQRETVAISQLSRQEKLRGVLEFSLSEDYFLLRQALGLAVQG